MRRRSKSRRREVRREPALVKLNGAATELLLGRRKGRPTFSARAGNAIPRATGMRRRTGKCVFHGGIGIAVGMANIATSMGATKDASAVIGLRAFLGLQSFDQS